MNPLFIRSAIASQVENLDLTIDLISFWELEEASGDRADAHGANDLTDENTVTQAVGKVGNAAQFTAANSEGLSAEDVASLSTGDIDFTLAAWIFLDTKTGNPCIVAKYGGTAETQEYVLRLTTVADNFELFVRGADLVQRSVQADTFGSPSTGIWYFIVAWYDSVNDTANISVNNGAVDQTVSVDGPADTDATFYIGRRELGEHFNGRIDQVGFWKRLLTAEEIEFLYNGGNGREYAEL